MNRTPLDILRSTFGYPAFRGHQEAAIEHVMQGGDAFVLMPTGGGKSLCYQVPALARDGMGVIVSPLIALMQNQVDKLRELGVRAAFLNSTLDWREQGKVEAAALRGKLDMLYVAPERLVMPATLELLKKTRLSLFAVDEAHCISQWGHDFRKEYLQLSMLHEEFPHVPRIALTATADERTRKEIVARLRLDDCKVFVSSFNRENIQYRVTDKKEPKEQLLTFIEDEHPGDSGIVYCLSRKSVENVATWLAERGHPALPYHAGLDAKVREQHLGRFLREEGIIVVATIAFGMGIDKPDVRFVAHLDLPKNLEAYYQETGRAGRDGEPATAWMTYGIQDAVLLRQMLDKSDGDEAYKRIERQKVQSMLGFCELTSCRRQALLKYFAETLSEPCMNCDTCLSPQETWDATIPAQMALSCVFRTRQRFGVTHLIDVLLGKATEKVRAMRHDQVSTFGIGKDHTERVWRSVYRQLVTRGLVRVDQYGALQLSEASTPLLQGAERLHLRKDSETPRIRRASRSRQRRAGATARRETPRAAVSNDLFQALARHRMELAKAASLPSYCIFHNTTLEQMAALKPNSLAALRQVGGVGDAKLAKYGEGFLRVIRTWQEG